MPLKFQVHRVFTDLDIHGALARASWPGHDRWKPGRGCPTSASCSYSCGIWGRVKRSWILLRGYPVTWSVPCGRGVAELGDAEGVGQCEQRAVL